MRGNGRSWWGSIATAVALLVLVAGSARAMDGDVNADGVVDDEDAEWVLQVVVGARTLPVDRRIVADVDGDGDIDVADAQRIRQLVAGVIQALPRRGN
jgi:hypothetical protein